MSLPTALSGKYLNYTAEPQWRGVSRLSAWEDRADRRWPARAYELYEEARKIYQGLTSTQREVIGNFRDKRRLFFNKLSLQFKDALRPYKEDSMLGLRVPKYSPDKKDLSFRIIPQHALVTGSVALVLAEIFQNELVSEKLAREGIDWDQFSDYQKQQFTKEAIVEVVFGTILQDPRKKSEIEFNQSDKEKRLAMLEVNGASEQLINSVKNDDKLIRLTFEKLANEKVKSQEYFAELGVNLTHYGNPETILKCARFAGMPVADMLEPMPSVTYQPSLAEIIANLSDKFVQDTSITDLTARGEYALANYGGTSAEKEKVEKEYKFATQCAQEIAQKLGIPENQLPDYLKEQLFNKIMAVQSDKPIV